MKERRFRNDWQSEYQIDPATGRETEKLVYVGAWYAARDAAACRRALQRAAAGGALFFALLLLYFLLDFPGVSTLYVFLPAGIALFPCLYWLMGAAVALRAPAKLRRVQRETGVGRMLRSAIGCAVCAGLAVLGDCVFLFAGGAAREELPGLPLLLAAVLTAALSARRCRAAYQSISEVKGS